eukprot:TRINITY_DN14514_c0_g1_i1.p1 TRINITY_DN14514_c0_g1~~TRINITY_DN14514_c0_g1_i1.p1  ORF type:complete len:378 (+),score=54.01 TRINITY_DN14514_c0_g1_i1:53-1186(+)
MGMDKKKLQMLRMLILILLWGVCGFFIVRLTIDYMDTGRKNTVDIETYQIDDLRVPWVFAPSEIGRKCYLRPDSCAFVKMSGEGIEAEVNGDGSSSASMKIIPCDNVFSKIDVMLAGYLVNSIALRKLGIGYTNPLDFLNVTLSIRYRENDTIVDPTIDIPRECEFMMPEKSLWVALLGDDTIMNELLLGNTINERDMPAPVHIGLGNTAAISYKLLQQRFINGTIKNGSEFTTTQYATRTPNMVEIRLLPLTFEVGIIKHKEGQSVIDLLGSVFGWIGVFTGACIFSVLDTAIEAYGKKEAQDAMDAEKPLFFVAESEELAEKTSQQDTLHSLREQISEIRAELDGLRYRGPASSSSSPAPIGSLKSYRASHKTTI